MIHTLILDTGPLVAYLTRTDLYHEWASARFAEASAPMVTCEAVVAEACWLMGHLPNGREGVLEFVTRGALLMPFNLDHEAAAISRLLRKYASVPMDLANACLVRMSEMAPRATILTIDSDFKIYRKHRDTPLKILTPFE